MKVYLTPPQPSRGLERIAAALRRYAPPNVTVHTFPRNNDVTIIYAIGRRDAIERQVNEILRRGQRYVIIQVCLRSTMTPMTKNWRLIWDNAAVVWSYYDLNAAIMADGGTGTVGNFYHAPLGADAEVFVANSKVKKLFTIATSGLSRLSESVRECRIAAGEVRGCTFHVGPRVYNMPSCVVFSDNCNDIELSASYQQCEFVSALRRTEGFELPGIEGLLCGARPICFDTPDYHWNYGEHAEYIHEGPRQEVVDQLVELFKRGARPVTEEERARAVKRFNWETIIGGFYQHIAANS
jgi:glycosyltransferase involved in cell wall biosynthesis